MECPKDGGCGGSAPSASNSDASASRWLDASPPPLGARDGATKGAEGIAITEVILESGVLGTLLNTRGFLAEPDRLSIFPEMATARVTKGKMETCVFS